MDDNYILKVQMFGEFLVSGRDGSLDDDKIRSEMMTKLLAYIFCHRRKKVTVMELAEALWHDDKSDNPAGALKNLMYRVRNIMKKEWGELDFILTGRGTYSWNPEVPVWIDAEEFERLCRQAKAWGSCEEKIEGLLQAVKLYRGPFLPKLSGEYWAASLSTYYHSLYLTSVKDLAALLEENSRFEEMGAVCQKAIQLDALDEELHCCFIKALIGQNKQNLALEHYQKTVDLLYDNLGVRPSRELREVYEELLKQKHSQELDLGNIQDELKSEDDGSGAFLCEYGVFKKSYHLEQRRASRLGLPVYISLITVYPSIDVQEDSEAYLKLINTGMSVMETVLISSLRNGDVISRYSGNQFIVMLPNCQYDSSQMIMKRIQDKFYTRDKKLKVKIQYSLDEIDLNRDRVER